MPPKVSAERVASPWVDGGDGVQAKWHDVGIVTHLHALFHKLVDHAPAVDVAAEEDQDVTHLELADDLDGGLVGPGCADDGSKAGMRPSTNWMPQLRSWMSSMGPLR